MALKVSRRASVDRYYLLKLWGYGLFVHHIHHSDNPELFHTHPWAWFSLILGSYTEERPSARPRLRTWFNRMRAGEQHRISLTHGPVWTLLVHGRRKEVWTVYDNEGHVVDVAPWTGLEKPDRTTYGRDP